jgi:hypothetical protein
LGFGCGKEKKIFVVVFYRVFEVSLLRKSKTQKKTVKQIKGEKTPEPRWTFLGLFLCF